MFVASSFRPGTLDACIEALGRLDGTTKKIVCRFSLLRDFYYPSLRRCRIYLYLQALQGFSLVESFVVYYTNVYIYFF